MGCAGVSLCGGFVLWVFVFFSSLGPLCPRGRPLGHHRQCWRMRIFLWCLRGISVQCWCYYTYTPIVIIIQSTSPHTHHPTHHLTHTIPHSNRTRLYPKPQHTTHTWIVSHRVNLYSSSWYVCMWHNTSASMRIRSKFITCRPSSRYLGLPSAVRGNEKNWKEWKEW